MLSVKFSRFGKPEEVLEVQEVETPSPKAGEVLVKMTARPINPSDLLTVAGLYGRLPKLPATAGYEGAGVVEKLGEGVTGLQVGQRVIPLGVVGTWQEYIIASPLQLLPTPDSLSDALAAQFVVNPLTAWIMVTDELELGENDWLLQTAAGSALGQMVIQISKLKGFKTINVVRRRDQGEELKKLGGDEVVCTTDEDLVTKVMEITEGKGVKAVIDAVGGKVGGDVLRTLASGGTMLVYGLLSMEPTPMDAGFMIFKTATVKGFWLSEWLARSSENSIAVMKELLTLMAQGKIAPPVEATYPLDQIVEAVKHAERAGRNGKVLLT